VEQRHFTPSSLEDCLTTIHFSGTCTIDECMWAYSGDTTLKVSIPRKPEPWGLRGYLCCFPLANSGEACAVSCLTRLEVSKIHWDRDHAGNAPGHAKLCPYWILCRFLLLILGLDAQPPIASYYLWAGGRSLCGLAISRPMSTACSRMVKSQSASGKITN
jgi:hypothetical protein